MNRRIFLLNSTTFFVTGGSLFLASCGGEKGKKTGTDSEQFLVSQRGKVILYDSYAMSLYMDGSLGPKTGTITVDMIKTGELIQMKFWHGHGGIDHEFMVTPNHFLELKKGNRVYIETTKVDLHTHRLFIDPKNPQYRVPGAKPVEVEA